MDCERYLNFTSFIIRTLPSAPGSHPRCMIKWMTTTRVSPGSWRDWRWMGCPRVTWDEAEPADGSSVLFRILSKTYDCLCVLWEVELSVSTIEILCWGSGDILCLHSTCLVSVTILRSLDLAQRELCFVLFAQSLAQVSHQDEGYLRTEMSSVPPGGKGNR